MFDVNALFNPKRKTVQCVFTLTRNKEFFEYLVACLINAFAVCFNGVLFCQKGKS